VRGIGIEPREAAVFDGAVPQRAMQRPQMPWMRRVSMDAVAVIGTISFASGL
jgi:hypothetical protein